MDNIVKTAYEVLKNITANKVASVFGTIEITC